MTTGGNLASQRIGNTLGVTATNNSSTTQQTNLNGSTGNTTEHSLTNLDSISSMRTRLAAIDSGFYTTARLNTMTRNDMVYAVRVNDYASTVK